MTTQIPKLRFPEFADNWEVKKLEDIAIVNPKNKALPNNFIYIDLESVEKGVLLKESRIDLEAAPSRAQRLLIKNDILFQTVRPYQKNNLFFDKDEKDYVASTGYAHLRTNNNSRYLFQILHTENFVNKVMLRCTGTSYPAINSTDLATIKIAIPQLPEQTKIANFLTAIDEKIQALKQKKTLLEQYKKGIMQQIFSQELRFKNDDGADFDDWEEKSLGEICRITIGEFVIRTKQNPNGKYPVFNGGKTYTGLYDEFNNEGNKIIISARGANAGFVNFQSEKYWAGNSCYSISVKDEKIHSIKYFFFYVKMFENRFLENQQAANIPSVSKKDAEMFEIGIPSLLEQQKIANFLTAIDEKLEKVNQQITATEAYKKGLLQQMFI